MKWGIYAAIRLVVVIGLVEAVAANAQVEEVPTTTGLIVPANAEAILAAQRQAENALDGLSLPLLGAAQPAAPVCDPKARAFNWRDHGKVTPVKDQRKCAACWAFAANAAIETSYMVVSKNVALMPNLSEQQVLDCALKKVTPPNGLPYDCNGGFFDGAFAVATQDGVAASSLYPAPPRYGFQQVRGACAPVADMPERLTIDDSRAMASVKPGAWLATADDIKQALCDYGGVASAISTRNMPGRATAFSTILEGTSSVQGSREVDHAIQIVGWDDNVGVWIIKNSWGEGWGEFGFARVRYNTRNIGFNAMYVRAKRDLSHLDKPNSPLTSSDFLNARATINAALPDLIAKKAALSVVGKQIMVMPKQ